MRTRHLTALAALAALVTLAWIAGPVCAAAREAAAQRDDAQGDDARPNIVFILADDLGWTDLGCQGSTYYQTPAIDRLALQSLRFTHGYTCGPNCQPTRAALMSGQYAPRTGVYTVGNVDRFDSSMRPLAPVENVVNLPREVTTIAEVLRQAGYATGMFGKWHLGNAPPYHPLSRGFDEAIESAGRHFNFRTNPAVETADDAYLADFITERALDFIARHRDEPFFLYVPHFAVHTPLEAKEEWIARFRDRPAAGGHQSATYAAMIASLDESVGRIMSQLDALELAERTLVIFSSDNGGVGGYERAGVDARQEITDNAPLRGGKGMLYEGGVRVPFLFRWPGHIAAGTVCDEPIISVDLYPTLLAATGAAPPDGQTLDGENLLPLLTAERAKLQRDALYWHFPGYLGSGRDIWRTTPVGAIRLGEYKLLEFFEDGRLELYDLVRDVGQAHDLAAERPELASQLHERLRAWRESLAAPLPRLRP